MCHKSKDQKILARYKLGQSSSVTTGPNRWLGEAQVKRDVTKKVHCTCVLREKKDQEVTLNFSDQKGQSEKKPDIGLSRTAED